MMRYTTDMTMWFHDHVGESYILLIAILQSWHKPHALFGSRKPEKAKSEDLDLARAELSWTMILDLDPRLRRNKIQK